MAMCAESVETVGFIGLGTMGSPMAAHLAQSGLKTYVWNRTPGKDELAKTKGATSISSIEELSKRASIICICVGTNQDVADVIRAALNSCKKGTLFIDHSTISPNTAKMLASECNVLGCDFMDAPITGGSMGAHNGTLTIFCGGTETSFNRAEPILKAYGKRIQLVGAIGQGQMMKLANQIAVGGALIGLCESMAFAKRAGLDLALTRELLNTGAAGSWAFENYGPKILGNDHSPGFSIKNQRKDFGYCIETAKALSMELPGTQLVDTLLSEFTRSGTDELATSALYDLILKGGDI